MKKEIRRNNMMAGSDLRQTFPNFEHQPFYFQGQHTLYALRIFPSVFRQEDAERVGRDGRIV
uniref:Uncharacterized protein n=1 Tax=Anguilla anguilla TaxID=7936 RepID=A0A0E9WM40_ANGAN